jgi:membrane protease YdiL (CAAX protease family)
MPDATADRPLETPLSWHLAVLAVAMVWPTVSTFLYFFALADTSWVQPVYGASKVLQFALPLAWVLLVQRVRPRWAWPTRPAIVWGLGMGLAIFAAGLTLYFGVLKHSAWLAEAPQFIAAKLFDMGLVAGAVTDPAETLAAARADAPWKFIAFASFLTIPHSLAEEYYYRWFIHGQLRRVCGPAPATALSSLAFMSHHVLVLSQFFEGQPAAVAFFSACVAIGGGLWAWLYDRTRSLYGPWLSHLLVDAAIMYAGYDLVWGG